MMAQTATIWPWSTTTGADSGAIGVNTQSTSKESGQNASPALAYETSRSDAFDSKNLRSDPFVNTRKTLVTMPIQRPEASGAVVQVPNVLLAEWNGCVTRISDEGAYFSATLKGVVGEGVAGVEEDAEIPISDVGEGDRELLKPGNFFRLCVVHESPPTDQPRRYTQVVFRRLPAFRKHDLVKANERAREIARGLRVE